MVMGYIKFNCIGKSYDKEQVPLVITYRELPAAERRMGNK